MSLILFYNKNWLRSTSSDVLSIILECCQKCGDAACESYLLKKLLCLTNIDVHAEEETPSKVPKVDTPYTQLVGVVPGQMGVSYPPQSTLGAIRPMYVLFNVYAFFLSYILAYHRQQVVIKADDRCLKCC